MSDVIINQPEKNNSDLKGPFVVCGASTEVCTDAGKFQERTSLLYAPNRYPDYGFGRICVTLSCGWVFSEGLE